MAEFFYGGVYEVQEGAFDSRYAVIFLDLAGFAKVAPNGFDFLEFARAEPESPAILAHVYLDVGLRITKRVEGL